MIQLTDRAVDGLKEILSASRAPSDQGVKLVPVEAGGVAMTIGRATEGDVVFDGEDQTLLIVDSSIAPHMDGAVIDLAPDGAEEPQFIIRREEPAEPS